MIIIYYLNQNSSDIFEFNLLVNLYYQLFIIHMICYQFFCSLKFLISLNDYGCHFQSLVKHNHLYFSYNISRSPINMAKNLIKKVYKYLVE